MKRRRLLFVIAVLGVVAIAVAKCGGVAVTSAPTITQPSDGGVVHVSFVGTDAGVSARLTWEWVHLSSRNGDLPAPSQATQQTASLILDVDKDGRDDFVIGGRQAGPAMVWYQRNADGWTKYLIDSATLDIEAGGTFGDIDRDGDLDVVMGGDYRSNKVWWWENPYPNYDPSTPWTRREIKNSGANKHHDQILGDFDGDGQAELVFWNQGAQKLFIADIPSDPRNTQPWSYQQIFSWSSGEHEGLAQADINGDGKVDIVGGGRWFEHTGGTSYTPHVIDGGQTSARAAAGQLKAGGRPEVVFVAGDGAGRLKWYEWTGSGWTGHDLLGFDVDHGHSLEVADIDGDGHLDIFCAEMRLDGDNADAKMWVFLGDGGGNFTQMGIATGYGNHESKVGDLDGDGDLDILGKPYNWDTPRVDVWLNGGTGLSLDRWQRHVVDADRPWGAIFITSADVDGDGQQDIITGGWWYRNPGEPGGDWTRHTIGSSLNNMAAVHDFDGDDDVDVLGTQGKGAESNPSFAWARNDGSGAFTILGNVESGDGDFLQGVAVERFQGGGLEVALSWHAAGKGVQRLTLPANPSSGTWTWDQISPASQDEALSAGDIDRDGDPDLLLGTKWLRNDGGSWSEYTLNGTSGSPDRNRLADVDGDGRLDAVVGFEAISVPGKLAWYEQGSSPTSTWAEHVISNNVVGPMSLDVADMDGDGDWDVVVGEHNLSSPSSAKLYVFENDDGQGGRWSEHVVHTGDEHHDGAQVVDIDGDGDLDIISIGWGHDQVLLYENRALIDLDPCIWLPVIPKSLSASGGLQVLYTFEEGSGTTVYDVSGVGTPLNLSVGGSGASWVSGGGLAINSSTIVASAGAATKVIDACRATNEITIEAWVKPANATQGGPARIVTLSADLYNRNFTLGQDGNAYDVRLRTTTTGNNGTPSLSSPDGSLTTALTQVVYTRDASGEARIYINDVQRGSRTVSGDFSNWNAGYRLALANELTGGRPWLGELHRVAIYNDALSQAEISQRFNAGR